MLILIDRDMGTHAVCDGLSFKSYSLCSVRGYSHCRGCRLLLLRIYILHLVKETSLQGCETVSSMHLVKKCLVNEMYKDAKSKLVSCVWAIDLT